MSTDKCANGQCFVQTECIKSVRFISHKVITMQLRSQYLSTAIHWSTGQSKSTILTAFRKQHSTDKLIWDQNFLILVLSLISVHGGALLILSQPARFVNTGLDLILYS